MPTTNFSTQQLKALRTFNRLLQSQTDFSAGKIFDPHFFLENILDLCHKMVINQKIPSPGPPGAPGGLLRGQTPQNKKIALLTKVLKKIFFLLHGIIQDINADPLKSKKIWIRPFFDPSDPKNGQKRAKCKWSKEFCLAGNFFIYFDFQSFWSRIHLRIVASSDNKDLTRWTEPPSSLIVIFLSSRDARYIFYIQENTKT